MNLLTSIPSWAVTEDAQAFWLGLGAGVLVRLVRATIRWLRRVAEERFD